MGGTTCLFTELMYFNKVSPVRRDHVVPYISTSGETSVVESVFHNLYSSSYIYCVASLFNTLCLSTSEIHL